MFWQRREDGQAFWDIASCSLLPDDGGSTYLLTRRSSSTRLHCAVAQKAIIFRATYCFTRTHFDTFCFIFFLQVSTALLNKPDSTWRRAVIRWEVNFVIWSGRLCWKLSLCDHWTVTQHLAANLWTVQFRLLALSCNKVSYSKDARLTPSNTALVRSW
jgi:hypothetical protein